MRKLRRRAVLHHLVIAVLALGLLPGCDGEKNKQLWSEQTYIGDAHTFTCADTDGELPFRVGLGNLEQVTLKWTKRGQSDPIVNDDSHLLSAKDGVENMLLTFKGVTDEAEGIYICHVAFSSGQVKRIVKGLNLGGPKYENLVNKYRSGIIVGFFSAFIFFLLVAGLCLFFHWDYCKPEERERRRLLNEEREEQQRRASDGGFLNLAMTSSSHSLMRPSGTLDLEVHHRASRGNNSDEGRSNYSSTREVTI